MENFEIGNNLYKITRGHLQNIEIRSGWVVDILEEKSKAYNLTKRTYKLESKIYGCYDGTRQQCYFYANEEELFKQEEIVFQIEKFIKENCN